jgi:hypothetical protein
LIIGASFGPDALKVITQAFDEAWASIADQYQTPDQVEAARIRLAQAMLAVSNEETRDVELLKRAGLQVMEGVYSTPRIRQG